MGHQAISVPVEAKARRSLAELLSTSGESETKADGETGATADGENHHERTQELTYGPIGIHIGHIRVSWLLLFVKAVDCC